VTLVNQVLSTLDYVTAAAVSSPAAETAILSTDVITAGTPSDFPFGAGPAWPTLRPVKIVVNLNITEGTSGTAFVVRVRQGIGVGGALVGLAQTVTLAAAANGQFAFVFRDSSGVPFAGIGTAYTVTVAETAATVAGTVNSIDVEVQQ